MSYPINQNLNPYKQPQAPMGMNSAMPGGNSSAMGLNTPQLQDMSVDKVIDNSALKGIKDKEEDQLFSKKTFLISLPVAAGMIYGMDKFNAACGGRYEKIDTNVKGKQSLVWTINDFGEKLCEKAPILDNLLKRIDNAGSWFNSKIASKSTILSALIKNPSLPENHMVTQMAIGTHAEIATEAAQMLEKYIEKGGKLKEGSATVDEIKKLVKEKRTKENIERIMEICHAQGNACISSEHFGRLKSIPLIGNILPDKYFSDFLPEKIKASKILNRDLYFSEFGNKIQAIIDPSNQKSVGKKLSKLTLRVLEGLTNGTAGGKFAMFMGAYFIADAVKKTIDAPNKNGEKRKVFTENIISNVGMYMTMPLSIVIMHKFGGLQYLGMGKGAKQTDNLKLFREKLEKLNADIDANLISNKEAYKARLKELKDIRLDGLKFKPSDSALTKGVKILKNIVYRPVMKLFNITAVGLERIKPYTKDSNAFMKFVKNGSYKMKGWAGYPMRMGIFMMAIAPFFNKILAKSSHLIFGRPEKSILDDVSSDSTEKAAKTLPPLIYPSQQVQAPMQEVIPQSVMQPVQQNNLANNSMDAMSSNTQRQRTMIPTESDKPTSRRYIPSQDGVKITAVDPGEAKARRVLAESQTSEKIANKRLG